MDKILFIINPISGKSRGKELEKEIRNILQSTGSDFNIVTMQYTGHAYRLAIENLSKYKKIVAVGGDGTVNEVSKALINQKNLLGIIPMGSGNGLARSLKIHNDPLNAINTILKGNYKTIDSGKINDYHFVNVAGIGFDAEIAHAFAKSHKRGFKTYFKRVIKDFIGYKPIDMIIQIKGQEELKINPFLVSFANSQQWGNNAYISPTSKVNDGLLEICVLNKFPLITTPIIAGRLFLKSIHKSKYMRIFQIEDAVFNLKKSCKGHVDGEPKIFNNTLNISVIKNSINVIV